MFLLSTAIYSDYSAWSVSNSILSMLAECFDLWISRTRTTGPPIIPIQLGGFSDRFWTKIGGVEAQLGLRPGPGKVLFSKSRVRDIVIGINVSVRPILVALVGHSSTFNVQLQ